MAKYYTINKITKKLCGVLSFGSNNSTQPKHDEDTILIPFDEKILGKLSFSEFHKSKVAVIVDDVIIGWQNDTEYDKDSETKVKLLKEYTSDMVNSVVIGSLESALDLVVQMLDKWVNDQTASEFEIAQWNAFVGANEGFFKTTIDKLTPKDIVTMATLKGLARKTQKDMIEDKRWPKEISIEP